MIKPNFFIVGMPRSGTTSLYVYLKQHPGVYLSIHKEPHFFGSDLSDAPTFIRDERLYLSLFADASGKRRVGEGSIWYLTSTLAAREIHAFARPAKIIAMIRNPVEMVHSLHSLSVRAGNEDLDDLEQALAAEEDRASGVRLPAGAFFPDGLLYTRIAEYYPKLMRFVQLFGRDNVHVIVFDDFVREPRASYRRALEFLDLEPSFEPEFELGKATRAIRPIAVRQLGLALPEVRAKCRRINTKIHDGGFRSRLTPELRSRLAQRFASDVRKVGDLLDRDLSAWTLGEPV